MAACTSTAIPTPVPTATPDAWVEVSRAGFSFALPPTWRVIDTKSANIAGEYLRLTTENPDFATFAPLEAFKMLASGADAAVLAFDFTASRASPGFFTMLVVGSETLETESKSQSMRNYLNDLRGATAYTTTNMRIGNLDGKRLSIEFPLKRSADEILNGRPPAPGAQLIRETSFVVYPGAGPHPLAPGVIRLTFLSRAELADAYESEFQAIAGRLVAK